MCAEEQEVVSDDHADVTEDIILLREGICAVTAQRYMRMSERELETARLLHANMSARHATSSSVGVGSRRGSRPRIPQVICRAVE